MKLRTYKYLQGTYPGLFSRLPGLVKKLLLYSNNLKALKLWNKNTIVPPSIVLFSLWDIMNFLFKKKTIQQRIKLVFLSTICFVGVLASGYTLNILELKSNLAVLEDLFVLSNNVLELRRFEKNFIYQQNSNQYNGGRN